MKFYYNGKLIRTSKCHIYTHAVIDTATGRCEGCRADKKNAESIISSEISRHQKGIEDCKRCINAVNQGKKGVRFYERNGWSWFRKFEEDDTVEHFEKWIKSHDENIERIKQNWKVVELEAR